MSCIVALAAAACSGGHGSLIPTPGNANALRNARNATANTTSAGVTVSGNIAALIAGGATIKTGKSCPGGGYLHVYVSNASRTGPAPAVGLFLSATGTGSCSTSVVATTVTVTGGTTTAAPIALQPNVMSVASTIASVWKGGFTLNPQPNMGFMHVNTNAATVFNGPTLKAGAYAQVAGTGSLRTFTGTYIALYASAPPSITVSGTAVAATAYGFTLHVDSTNATVPVVLDARTIVGGAPLTTGSNVKITGIGAENVSITARQIVVTAPSPSPGASPTPTPPPIATKHLLTADYLGSPYGTTSVAWSTAATYLSWAQTSMSNANAVSAAGIKTQFYADPNRTVAGVGDPLYTTDESTFAHDCSGNRISDVYAQSVTQYTMDIGSASMQNVFKNYLTQVASQAHFDAVYEDDAGPLSGYSPYTPFSAMPCNYTDATWLADGDAIDAAPPIPIVYNGLSALAGHDVSLAVGLLNAPNTSGANYEHCYSDNATPKMTGWLWQAIENSEAQVTGAHKLFECQLRNSGEASTQTDARLYALASFLLTYDPATSILWEEFATPSGLRVMPEAGLVALDPAVPAPSSIAALQVAGGTYGREFAHCFLRGTFVGACAVVVNPDSQLSHPFPFPQYTRSLVLTGDGVLDGGSVSTTGPPPPMNLAPAQSAVVFR
jgi:hypothetical protein